MTSSTFTEVTSVAKEEVWAFLAEKENWAVLVPGYLHHECLQQDEMIWVFKGDFGIIEKAVKVQLRVTEVVEQERIAFDLIGLSDPINGSGTFVLHDVNGENAITGMLTMKADGFLATILNSVLEKFVPQTVKAHVTSITGKIDRLNA